MSAAEQTKEVVELAVGYTKQIVEALTPIAKQAYEIGLLTLRIDAIQALLVAFVFFVLAVIAGRFAYKGFKMASKGELHGGEYFLLEKGSEQCFFGTVAAFLAGVPSVCALLNIWLWVKLFSPELWLAHQAVEKLLK